MGEPPAFRNEAENFIAMAQFSRMEQAFHEQVHRGAADIANFVQVGKPFLVRDGEACLGHALEYSAPEIIGGIVGEIPVNVIRLQTMLFRHVDKGSFDSRRNNMFIEQLHILKQKKKGFPHRLLAA